MKLVILAFAGGAILRAQAPANFGPSAEVQFPAGSSTKQMLFRLTKAPVKDDRLIVDLPTKRFSIVLITPSGQRINKETAQAAGLEWSDMDITPPIGSTDAGVLTAIAFNKSGTAGSYTLELTPDRIKQAATVKAQFVESLLERRALISSTPEIRRSGPQQLTTSQDFMEFVLDRDEEGAMFDLVSSEPAAKLTLTLPDGRKIDESVDPKSGVAWRTVKNFSEIDRPDATLRVSPFLLPDEGSHNIVGFAKVAKGRYLISTSRQPTHVTVQFVPFSRIFQEASDQMGKPPEIPPGEVRLQPYALPYDCKVGDTIRAAVGVLGDPLTNLRFELSLEYRQIVSRRPLIYSEPVVEKVPATFIKDAQGRYAASFVPPRPGILRVGISVSGQRSNGQMYSDAIVLTQMTVFPAVARITSLTEKAIRTTGKNTLQRMEITAHLRVAVAGRFRMDVSLNDQHLNGVMTNVEASLGVGEQTLTATISAEEIRRRMEHDGPWKVERLNITRIDNDELGQYVTTEGMSITTAAYKRDDWDRGQAFGERTITARGIHPTATGRFRLLEIVWKVTTLGGPCSWSSSLFSPATKELYRIQGQGTLPKGAAELSFVFDGVPIANPSTSGWIFSTPFVTCESGNLQDEGPIDGKLALYASEFEPRQNPFPLTVQQMIRVSPGQSASGLVSADGLRLQDVQFRLSGQIAEGKADILVNSGRQDLAAQAFVDVVPSAAAKPGRYFLPIEASSAKGTSSAEIVIDIVK